jgi:hypothetical protein
MSLRDHLFNRRTWKWTKKLFFHLFYLAILNTHNLYSSCRGKNISHQIFVYNPSEEFVGTGWTRTEWEDHLVCLLKLLDLKNAVENTGVFRLPRADVMFVRPGVTQEKF